MKSTLGLTDTVDSKIEEGSVADLATVENPRQRMMAIVGTILMTVGVFMPIVRFPIYGSLNYFNNGTGDGVIILVIAGLSFSLLATRKYSASVILGGISLAVLSFTFLRLIVRISIITADADKELTGNPYRGIASAMVSAVQIEWGWLPLFGGAALLVVAGWGSRTPWARYSAPVKWSVILIAAALVFVIAVFAFTVLQVEGIRGFLH